MTDQHNYAAYSGHPGCRCEVCREAARLYRRDQRAKRLSSPTFNHGSRAAYDCGCRCAICRGARRDAYDRVERRVSR